MSIWDRIATNTRNLIQRIPGGAEAFPLEPNGTIDWYNGRAGRDAGRTMGGTVLGRAGEGAAMATLPGYGLMYGGRSGPSRNDVPRPSVIPRGGSGTGSVVGRGFIGGGSGGRVGLSNTPSVPSVSRALGIDRGPSVIGRTDPGVNARMGDPDVAGVVGGGDGMELPGGGGGQRNPGSRGLGAGQLGQASADVLANQEARFRARGGLMQER